MLKSVELCNFESHKFSRLEFGAGVNCLVGDSEQGKSSVIRGLYWVVFNRPAGNDFLSHWGGLTKVTVTTDKGIVTREKGKGTNRYVVYKDNKEIVLDAPKQNVPAIVTEIIGLSEINFKTQFSDHYLLPPTSPGEVARTINQYVDLEVIDASLSNVNSLLRETEKELRNNNALVDGYKASLQEYDYIEDAEQELAELEATEQRVNSLLQQSNKLTDSIEALINIDTLLDKYTSVDSDEIDSLITLDKEYDTVWEERNSLVNYLSHINKIDIELKEISIGDKETLDALMVVQDEYESLLKERTFLVNIKYLSDRIQEMSTKIALTESKLEKAMPEVCPLCGKAK